jgi:hypothetical protein
MVLGKLLEHAATEAVDAAITDVRHEGAAIPNPECGERASHLGQTPAAFFLDGAAREADGHSHPALGDRSLVIEAVINPGIGPLLDPIEVGVHRIDADPRCDLAAFVSAHSIGDEEEPDVRVDSVGILIVGTPSDVCCCVTSDLHNRLRCS